MPRHTEQTDTIGSVAPPVAGGLQKRPYLLMLTGPHFGQMVMLEFGREMTIGRQEGMVEILVHDDGVSRRHASIIVDAQNAQIRDLGSANGTFVDGVRITDCPLEDGSRIHIGMHSVFKFSYTDDIEAVCHRWLSEGAFHEPLTGLCNRRHFMDRLSAELAASRRHGHPLSLLLVDIDHFKAVNDRYGHPAGDEALKLLAHVLQGAIRQEDVLARYGGEEFIILARETGLTGGKALAERIRKAVERSSLSWDGKKLSITISIGISTVDSRTSNDPSHRLLLETADRALHQAKQEGRNRAIALPVSK